MMQALGANSRIATPPSAPPVAPATDDGGSKSAPLWMPAVAMGAVAAAAMHGPSMFPKDPRLQKVGIVVAGLLGAGVGAGVEGATRALDKHLPGDRLATQVGLGAGGAAIATGVTLATRGRATGAPALGKSLGIVAATGSAAAAAGTLVAQHDGAIPGHDALAQMGVAAAAGGTMLGASALALRGMRGTSHLLPSLPQLNVDPATVGKLAVDHGREVRGPATSGGADSLVSWDAMPAPGRRFLSEMPRAAEIDAVMGTTDAKEPVRAYVGLDHSPAGLGEAEGVAHRAGLAVDELDRLGAFGRFETQADGTVKVLEQPRRSILVDAPTSTGFVNPVAVSAHEMFLGGDTATVAVQVARSKSAAEMHHVARSSATHQAVLERVSARLAQLPEGVDRPTLRVYGESYGAWSSQNGFAGDDAAMLAQVAQRFAKWDGPTKFSPAGVERMDKLGVDQAIYVGTPSFSKFRGNVLADPKLTAGEAPIAMGVRSQPDARAKLTPDATQNLRVAFLQHDADPVGIFSPKNLYEDFLGPKSQRGENVPRHMRQIPGVSGIQMAFDQQMAQFFKPGTLESKGHDYRLDVPEFLDKTMRTGATDEQIGRVGEWNRQLEVIRMDREAAATKLAK